MTSLRIFSRLIIVLRGDDDYFTKRLIISCVEICSKPMAILMYDDLCVCVRVRACICVFYVYFCNVCTSSLSWISWRDIIFLRWIVCCLCGEKKIEVISEWAGQTETQEVKEREKTDGDEGESGGLRRRLMMEKESRHSRLEKKVHRDGVLFTWKASVWRRPVSLSRLKFHGSLGHWIVLAI